MTTRISRLSAALDAATDIGIYPAQVIGGKKPYKKRTEYMEGWNDAQRASLKAVQEVLKPGDWK